MSETYLPDGLPTPIPMNDGLDKPYWDGLLEGKILVQRCGDCGNASPTTGPRHVPKSY